MVADPVIIAKIDDIEYLVSHEAAREILSLAEQDKRDQVLVYIQEKCPVSKTTVMDRVGPRTIILPEPEDLLAKREIGRVLSLVGIPPSCYQTPEPRRDLPETEAARTLRRLVDDYEKRKRAEKTLSPDQVALVQRIRDRRRANKLKHERNDRSR